MRAGRPMGARAVAAIFAFIRDVRVCTLIRGAVGPAVLGYGVLPRAAAGDGPPPAGPHRARADTGRRPL